MFLDEERGKQSGPGGLLHFVKYFWDVLEPQTPLVVGWPLEAICDHLEAIARGQIKRLLMNVPPGFSKSLCSNVFFPAYEWGPMAHPHLRYVTFSYAAQLTERDNRRFLALIQSPEYQELWGDRPGIRLPERAGFILEKTGETLVSNNQTGWKFASSVGGVGTGERGNRVILDDPHSVTDAESETVRTRTVRWFQETMENRLNSLKDDAIIIIMQRVHEADVSGAIIKDGGYEHLMIPMEYDVKRHCRTSIGWSDPRKIDGELAWRERFSPTELAKFKKRAFMWSGQYGQDPEPRGGGIFKRDWWRPWNAMTAPKHGYEPGTFPQFNYVLAVLDTAFTEKEENDPCAMTVWGIWQSKAGPAAMLINSWEDWLEFGPLITKTMEVCVATKPNKLLIEAKANGISIAQELQRRYRDAPWSVDCIDPAKGDKVARAYSVTHLLEDGLVWAPEVCDDQGQHIEWRKYVERVIDQASKFPKSAHMDLTDTMTMGLKYLRDIGLLLRNEEWQREQDDAALYRPEAKPLYSGL